MAYAEIPSEIQSFIERHLTTSTELEVLLLLHRDEARHWTPAAVGRELRIDDDQAGKALARLAADGLFLGEEPGYRFAPRRPRTAALINKLAALYPSYRVAMISLIFAKPRGAIRDFAEAFRIKPEDEV